MKNTKGFRIHKKPIPGRMILFALSSVFLLTQTSYALDFGEQNGIEDYLPYILAFVLVLIIIFPAYKKLNKGNGKNVEKKKNEAELIEWAKERLKSGEDPKILKEGLTREGVNPEIVDRAIERLWL